MLVCLRVRHFAIIDELEVELAPGLNVVTGETGAGKSILIDALQLVLGGKGRPEVVRTGEAQAEVEALFELKDDESLRQRLADAGLEPGDELLVRRIVQANGRTRAYVNGQLATASQLATLATGLADISSQHEHQSLADPGTHLRYLDAFGRHDAERERVRDAYVALADAAEALRALGERTRDRSEREDLLRYQIREIDELDPKEDEESELIEERERLRYADKLATTAGSAEEALYAQDDAVCEALAKIGAELREVARIDGRLTTVAEQVDAARVQLEDAAQELGRYARAITVDPERLATLEERLDRLGRLKRKYGGSIADVLAHRERATSELDALENHEARVAEAEAKYTQARNVAEREARALSVKRQKTAGKLGTAISEELRSLGMGDARVLIEVARTEGRGGELEIDGARLSPAGIDRAEFLIAPNRGEEPRPLRRIASGGELSRALLAIKRVLAGLGPVGLYVFDEVDAGVGGAVAAVIGRKLRDVAAHHQVLCITHLPQIAVFADAHYNVRKAIVGDRTRSDIQRLAEKERLEEVARMLGGLKITQRTRAAAAEMLREAQPGTA